MHIKTSNQPAFELGFGDISCNWGVHMAGLYETEEEKDQIVFGFLSEGFKNNDLELYCPSERTADEFFSEFSENCPHCAAKMKDPDILQLFSTRDLYYPDGIFSPEIMDVNLNNFFAESQQKGHRNVRATAEMVWALRAIPGIEHLMAYESRLNYFIPGKPWISICMYDLTRFDGETIMNVLRTHPFTISKGVITQNPYYQDPDTWLSQNAPEFLPRNSH